MLTSIGWPCINCLENLESS